MARDWQGEDREVTRKSCKIDQTKEPPSIQLWNCPFSVQKSVQSAQPRRRKPAFVTHDNEASLCVSVQSYSQKWQKIVPPAVLGKPSFERRRIQRRRI